MPILRVVFYLTRLILALTFCLMLVLWVKALQGVGRPVTGAKRQQLTQYGLAFMASALPFRIHIYGTPPKQTALWVANHISWTDILILGGCAPLSFLSKAEVQHWPVAGWLAKEAGTLFIQRGNAVQDDVQGQVVARLQQRLPVLIFPEGTTTEGHQPRKFHARLFSCAADTGVPIQPVAIRYRRHGQLDAIAPFVGDDSLPTHLMRLLSQGPAVAEVYFLPLQPSEHHARNTLAQHAQHAIAQTLVHSTNNPTTPAIPSSN